MPNKKVVKFTTGRIIYVNWACGMFGCLYFLVKLKDCYPNKRRYC